MSCSLRVTPAGIVLYANKTVKLSKKVALRLSDLMDDALAKPKRRRQSAAVPKQIVAATALPEQQGAA